MFARLLGYGLAFGLGLTGPAGLELSAGAAEPGAADAMRAEKADDAAKGAAKGAAKREKSAMRKKPPVSERGEPGDGRRVEGTIAVEGSGEAGTGHADASATSSAGSVTPTVAPAAPLLTAAELERPLLRREDLPPGYFLSGAELGPRSASRRWSAPSPEVELGAIELLHVDTRGGRPPERDLSEGLGPLDDHLGLGDAGDRVRLYGGTPKAELGLRPRLSYVAVVERGPSLLKIKIIEGAGADAGALIPTALRPLVERSLVRLGRAPDPSPAALQPLSREKLAVTLLLAEDVVPLPGPRPEKAPSPDGEAYRAAAAAAGAAASVVQTWRGRGGETRGVSLAQVIDRRATFASEAAAQRFIARRLAGDADFQAAARHVARERSGGPEGIAAVADSEGDEDLKRAALEIVDDAAVTYRILDLAPWVRRLASRPTRTGDGQVVGGRYLAIGRAGSLVAEVEVLAYHGAGASEVAAARVLELLDLGLDRAVDAVEGAAPKAPVLVVPEADPRASGLQITGSGPGGSRSRSRQIRDYWRNPPKEGIGWVGFYYGGPASRQDIEGVAVRSRYTLNFDAAVLIRPRIYFGFAYRRSKWRTIDVDPALNLNINRLEVYYGLPLLALPPTWRVRPEFYGIAGLGFGWAVARFAYDDGGSDVDASVGGGAILGAEAALDIRTGEKYGVRLRGGVIRGLYSYAQDHLAERRFADSLQWFAGLSVGFY